MPCLSASSLSLISWSGSASIGWAMPAVDLTGQQATALLTVAAQRNQIESATYHRPHDLDRCGLLAEPSPAQRSDAHRRGDAAGAPGGARADRAVDVRTCTRSRPRWTGAE